MLRLSRSFERLQRGRFFEPGIFVRRRGSKRNWGSPDISTRVRAVFAQFNRTLLSHPFGRKLVNNNKNNDKNRNIFLFESIVRVYKLVNYLPFRKLRVAR